MKCSRRQCKREAPEDQKVCLACTKAQRDYSLRKRKRCIDAYGGKCACCGEAELGFLTLDHINGDGALHRRAMQQAHKDLVGLLIKQGFPEGFRVLCYNCNCGRAGNGGVCPHSAPKLVIQRQKECTPIG